MDFMDYIVENALVLIPALSVVGLIIKGIPGIPDWIIPFALLVLGVAGAFGLMGVSADSAIQGIMCAGASVLGHQLVKQGVEGLTFKPPDAGK